MAGIEVEGMRVLRSITRAGVSTPPREPSALEIDLRPGQGCRGVLEVPSRVAPFHSGWYRRRMKVYHEYLELHSYFARAAEPRLTQREFEAADREFRELAEHVSGLTPEQRARLRVLKALLFRDRP